LTLHTAKAVGFLIRWGVPPSVVLKPLRKRDRFAIAVCPTASIRRPLGKHIR
jgi:hypothetical protein